MIAIYQEWESQNARRNYPFADLATLTDQQGIRLPLDFLLDAVLYPADLQGVCYLQNIVGPARQLVFGDSVTRKSVGTAQWVPGAVSVVVYDVSGYSRPIGILQLGPGITYLESNQTRTFDPEATPLTPTCFFAVNQQGVQGIILPDGTLMTGDITIEGQDGIVVTTAGQTLRVDAVGKAAPDQSSCEDLGVPICAIRVIREPGSIFLVSKYDPFTLALTLNGPSLDSICAASTTRQRSSVQPSIQIPTPVGDLYTAGNDVCQAPGPTPPAPDPGVQVTLDFPICTLASRTFLIVAPSSLNYRNPVSLSADNQAPAAQQLGDQTDVTAAQAGKEFISPPMPAGVVKIEIQGVKQ